MPATPSSDLLRHAAAEVALLAAIGVTLAFLGPFETSQRSLAERLAYWLILIYGGGVIGVTLDEVARRRLRGFWPRLLTVSVAMTPLVALLVMGVSHRMFGAWFGFRTFAHLQFQVFLICLATMALRQLAWSVWPARPVAALPPPPDDPWRAFRQRLSARRRQAALIAVQAEDHYLRVHTDAGDELITLRFADALAELADGPGFRTHRSWWVAADAIEAVRWRRGRGEARLAGGLSVPVSRSQAPALKSAGWF